MEYEIVELEEKTVFGLSVRTNNQTPDVGAVIGGLWETFFVQGIYESIPDKCSGLPLGIYSGYASFVVKGHMRRAVAAFWQELWKMDLDRAFGADFEEYQNQDTENTVIHIYVGLR